MVDFFVRNLCGRLLCAETLVFAYVCIGLSCNLDRELYAVVADFDYVCIISAAGSFDA